MRYFRRNIQLGAIRLRETIWNGWNCEEFLFVSIFELIPLLNSFICFLMYRKNALLDHLPSSMIVQTRTPERYIAIAAPHLAECRPISFGVNPSLSFPIAAAASLI